jgi:hypothetical protein
MSTRHNGTRAKRSVSASVAIGLMLVPLSAFAASVLVDRATGAEPVEDVVEAPAAAPMESAVPAATTSNDLVTACGDAGPDMVAMEAEGTISAIQQAALDALRPICADHGLALPGKPAPPPVVETVVLAELQPLPEPPASATTSFQDDDDDHGDDDDDHGDDDDEDDDDHDEDHD